MTIEDRRALLDASHRLTAALRHVGDRCGLADRARAIEHRFGQPGVPDGRDPVGLVFACVEAVATLAEAVDQELALAAAGAQPKRVR